MQIPNASAAILSASAVLPVIAANSVPADWWMPDAKVVMDRAVCMCVKKQATLRFISHFVRWTREIARNVITANSAGGSTGMSFGRSSNMGMNHNQSAQRLSYINEIAFDRSFDLRVRRFGRPRRIA